MEPTIQELAKSITDNWEKVVEYMRNLTDGSNSKDS